VKRGKDVLPQPLSTSWRKKRTDTTLSVLKGKEKRDCPEDSGRASALPGKKTRAIPCKFGKLRGPAQGRGNISFHRGDVGARWGTDLGHLLLGQGGRGKGGRPCPDEQTETISYFIRERGKETRGVASHLQRKEKRKGRSVVCYYSKVYLIIILGELTSCMLNGSIYYKGKGRGGGGEGKTRSA